MAHDVNEIIAHVRVGVAAVDESEVDRGEAESAVVREELRAGQLVMGDDAIESETAEVVTHPLRVAPLRRTTDRLERSVSEHGIRRVDEGQGAASIVLQAERQADDA